jgi:predicted metal-dependent enzyme (double-stranded beta helix superfamily)
MAFTIEGFIETCKQAMASADDPQAAAKALMEKTFQENDTDALLAALDAAIPPGADVGQMVFHTSSDLTLLYGRIPPRFQSAIHDHTLFACIGQLVGEEKNIFYERLPEGGLRVTSERTAKPGGVLTLGADAIHSIENPQSEPGLALHLYGGDFNAVQDRRTLWTSGEHQEIPFSFPALMRESARAMKLAGNQAGLEALVVAIPATKPIVEGLAKL